MPDRSAPGALWAWLRAQLTTELAERLLLLQQAQQHSAAVFLEFATTEQQLQWHLLDQATAAKQLRELRTMIQQLAGTESSCACGQRSLVSVCDRTYG